MSLLWVSGDVVKCNVQYLRSGLRDLNNRNKQYSQQALPNMTWLTSKLPEDLLLLDVSGSSWLHYQEIS